MTYKSSFGLKIVGTATFLSMTFGGLARFVQTAYAEADRTPVVQEIDVSSLIGIAVDDEKNYRVMNPDEDLLDDSVSLDQIKGNPGICQIVYDVEEGSLDQRVAWAEMQNDVVTIHFEAQSDAKYAMVLGHIENVAGEDICEPGFEIDGKSYVAMPVGVYMALQNGKLDRDDMRVYAVAGKGVLEDNQGLIAQGFEVQPDRATLEIDSRKGDYSSHIYVLVEPMADNSIDELMENLQQFGVQKDTLQEVIVRQSEDGLYYLKSGTSVKVTESFFGIPFSRTVLSKLGLVTYKQGSLFGTAVRESQVEVMFHKLGDNYAAAGRFPGVKSVRLLRMDGNPVDVGNYFQPLGVAPEETPSTPEKTPISPTPTVIPTPTPEPEPTPPVPEGNPGNPKPVGKAGETPNNRGGWNEPDDGPGVHGQSDPKPEKPKKNN